VGIEGRKREEGRGIGWRRMRRNFRFDSERGL